MTFDKLTLGLKKCGIWRAVIEETSAGVLTLWAPKTSKWRVEEFIWCHIASGIKVKVKYLESPLKMKKYTYKHTTSTHWKEKYL